MMRITKVILIVLILSGITTLSLGCAPRQDSAATENEVITVQRGDLTVAITAVGNLALSQTEDLAFVDMAGTVEEVLIKEGDSVTEGQVLAKLDTSEWEEQLSALEDKVTAAERNLTVKERALVTAERLIGTKELAVRQAELDLQTAEYNLGQIAEVKKAQDAVDEAEFYLKTARINLGAGETPGADYWLEQVTVYQDVLKAAQENLQAVLDGNSMRLSTSVKIQVAKYQLLVEQAQRQLEDARIAVENARLDKSDAEQDVEDAQEDVRDAQEKLDEAESFSPLITAPFDGFITRVNVEGGDEVLKGTVAVQIADPNKFEAEINVNEMDISQLRLGGDATVEVDAMQMIVLTANVTHISPTATIQSGVVNYRVKVELQSLEDAIQQRQEMRQQVTENITQSIQQGELPDRLKQAIAEGSITQEQAEEMMKRIQAGDMPFPPASVGGQMPFSPESGQSQQPLSPEGGQFQTRTLEDFQLREGLTVTVNIIMDSRADVLLVPNAAISTQGRQTYVTVVLSDGTTEERAIETDITDYLFTEVTNGLSDGEQVVVPQGTAATTTTTRQPGVRMPFFSGGGGH
ncbi:efflux RND transporter periplasmic adaptor subunit [Chloroflexota bacterium]